MENKDLKLAYMAGILDGDGSFSLIKRKTKSPSPQYIPYIQLANASKELIESFTEFGGNTTIRLAYKAKDGGIRKENYQWKLKGLANCLEFLDSIIPYLILKKERAIFLRDYILLHPFNRGNNVLSNEELLSREQSYITMLKFNSVPDISNKRLKQKRSDDKMFWSYVAGIMDSDGSFSLKKENKGRKSPTYTPLISVSMTDCRTIYYIMSNFIGANMIVVKAKTTFRGFCYRFIISSKSVIIDFLKRCAPYLLIKKEQAKILLEFCENFKETKSRMYGVDAKELEFRELCYKQMIKANNMGSINLL